MTDEEREQRLDTIRMLLADVVTNKSMVEWMEGEGRKWDEKSPPLPGAVYVPVEAVPSFFEKCFTDPDYYKPYVVVSADSDFGVVFQGLEHPTRDAIRMLSGHDWRYETQTYPTHEYAAKGTPPMVNRERSRPNDCYALKCDRYTEATFPDLPPNIFHWFTTNLGIVHPRATCLPFGLPHGNDALYSAKHLAYLRPLPKMSMLYVNFGDNTVERLRLKRAYRHQSWVDFHERPDRTELQFLEDVVQNDFVLCPAGNGKDCFRTYQAICLGSIPVLEESLFSHHLRHLPVLVVKDLAGLTADFLLEQRAQADARGLLGELSPVPRWLLGGHWRTEVRRAEALMMSQVGGQS